jgi:ribose-phosphate pyrophosphokinase
MSLIKATNLGVIACPGAESFSGRVLDSLKHIYAKKFNKRAVLLAKKYNCKKEEIIEQINKTTDLFASSFHMNGSTQEHRTPHFDIPVQFSRFANGEFKAEIQCSIRGMDVYVIQDVENHYPTCFNGCAEEHTLSINDHVMLLFVTIDSAFQAGAESVTVILPAYPFARQHKKRGREPLTASWFGRTLESMGVTKLITLDIHSKEIENTFNTLRLENLHASYQILRKLGELVDLREEDLVVLAPDLGSADRNKYFSSNLKRPLALLYKERDYSRVSHDAKDSNIVSTKLLGDVKDKIVFMADDMLGTGGTIINAMRQLKTMGASKIIVAVSLPFFSGNAIEHFDNAYKEGLFYRIIGTDAVYHSDNLLNKEWYEPVAISNLFARIIYRLHHKQSLSTLLDNSEMIQKLLRGKSTKKA